MEARFVQTFDTAPGAFFIAPQHDEITVLQCFEVAFHDMQ